MEGLSLEYFLFLAPALQVSQLSPAFLLSLAMAFLLFFAMETHPSLYLLQIFLSLALVSHPKPAFLQRVLLECLFFLPSPPPSSALQLFLSSPLLLLYFLFHCQSPTQKAVSCFPDSTNFSAFVSSPCFSSSSQCHLACHDDGDYNDDDDHDDDEDNYDDDDDDYHDHHDDHDNVSHENNFGGDLI